MVTYSMYSVIPSPVDDSVWGISETYPGILVRLQRGNNPPSTCKAQIFRVPAPGFDPRGVDIDTQRRRLDRAGREQPPGELRRAQVQGPRWTSEDGRQPVPGRLDAVSDRRSQDEGDRRAGRLPLLQLGGSAQHLGARRQHADRDRVELRRAARPQSANQAVGDACACRIRSASIRAGWTAASTTRTPAGRAAACGRTMARTSSGTSKAARARKARWCTSRFGRIRSRDN